MGFGGNARSALAAACGDGGKHRCQKTKSLGLASAQEPAWTVWP
jgi:hypothetical protein